MAVLLGDRGMLGRAARAAWWMAAGIAPIAVYQPKGAANLAASYSNLYNPATYNLTAGPSGDPGWSAAVGWDTTAVSGRYLITGIVPAQGHSLLARFANLSAGLGAIAAIGANGLTFGMQPFAEGAGGTAYYAYGAGIFPGGGTALATGVCALTPTGVYHNGVLIASHANTIGAVTDALFLLASNNGGAVEAGLGGHVSEVAIWDQDISAGVPALTAAIMAL